MNDKDREPKIHSTAQVDDSVILGDWSVVGARAQIRGKVEIGRAAWICEDAIIGGGQSERGYLRAGEFLHMGIRSFVNTADVVTIGNEVGLGMDTKVFSHGGYLSEFDGFPFARGPVKIGNRVWLPYAVVLPNVQIGNNTVVAAMSVVTKNLPAGCLAGGVPATILLCNAYPYRISNRVAFFAGIKDDAQFYGIDVSVQDPVVIVGNTRFVLHLGLINGPVTKDTERLRDVFRRRGVRFRYYDNNGVYERWD